MKEFLEDYKIGLDIYENSETANIQREERLVSQIIADLDQTEQNLGKNLSASWKDYFDNYFVVLIFFTDGVVRERDNLVVENMNLRRSLSNLQQNQADISTESSSSSN